LAFIASVFLLIAGILRRHPEAMPFSEGIRPGLLFYGLPPIAFAAFVDLAMDIASSRARFPQVGPYLIQPSQVGVRLHRIG